MILLYFLTEYFADYANLCCNVVDPTPPPPILIFGATDATK
jgi:hypothetical protein